MTVASREKTLIHAFTVIQLGRGYKGVDQSYQWCILKNNLREVAKSKLP